MTAKRILKVGFGFLVCMAYTFALVLLADWASVFWHPAIAATIYIWGIAVFTLLLITVLDKALE